MICVRYLVGVSSSLHPSEGIRLLLERESVADDMMSAAYRGAVFTPEQSYAYRVTLSMDGSAVLEVDGESASEQHVEQLRKIAKSTARAAKRKQDEQLPPWPLRVLRWRVSEG